MNGSSAFAQQQILLETVPRDMENKEVTGDGQRGFSKTSREPCAFASERDVCL